MTLPRFIQDLCAITALSLTFTALGLITGYWS